MMKDMEKLCKLIEEELKKISEKGLTTSNLETAYKLVDMYKDLKNTEYWEQKGEYYMAVLEEMEGGGESYYRRNEGYSREGGQYSERRRRDSRGRFMNDGMDYEDGMSMARGGRGGNNRGRNQYSRDGGYSREGGYSRNDGYSREGEMFERYMNDKQSYRANGGQDGKQRLMQSLEEYMDEFTEKVKEMSRDADTPEERELINKFMKKLQNM